MVKKIKFDHGLTHAGVFHADDVFSTALLEILNPDFLVVRSNQIPTDYDGIIYDIGEGEFDHHKADSRVRENGIPYAAFGLLWERFGHLILTNEADFSEFDRHFVSQIDLADNTGEYFVLSQIIKDFLPQTGTEEDYNTAFEEAVSEAKRIMERRFSHIQYQRASYEEIKDLVNRTTEKVIYLNKLIPWKKAVIYTPIEYVIYQSIRGGYNIQAAENADGSLKRPFPELWRGFSGRELSQRTRVNGSVFCHKSGFLMGTETEEQARQIVEKIYQKEVKGV